MWFRKKDDDLFQSWCRFPTHADMAPRAVFGCRSQNCMPTHTLGTYYERVSQHPIPLELTGWALMLRHPSLLTSS